MGYKMDIIQQVRIWIRKYENNEQGTIMLANTIVKYLNKTGEESMILARAILK